jgi:hypothetical protein
MTKRKNPKDLETRGRKTIMTPEIIAKLEQAFSMGCSDLEACLHANIGKTTLYNYQNENPKFVERKEQLKEKLVLKARTVIAEALNKKDENTAKWYLERKKKDEFGKADTEINLGLSVEVKDNKSKDAIEDLWND